MTRSCSWSSPAWGRSWGGLNYRFRGRLSRAHRAVQESFSRVTARLVEAVHGVQVTQGFAREAHSARRFRKLVTDIRLYNLEAARTAGLFVPLLEFNSQTFLAAILLIGGYRVLVPGSHVPVGELIQFMFLANIFFQPIQTLGEQYNQALLSMAGAERVRRFLAVAPDWVDPPTTQALGGIAGRVTFDRVSFAYDAHRPVATGYQLHGRARAVRGDRGPYRQRKKFNRQSRVEVLPPCERGGC